MEMSPWHTFQMLLSIAFASLISLPNGTNGVNNCRRSDVGALQPLLLHHPLLALDNRGPPHQILLGVTQNLLVHLTTSSILIY